MNFRKNCFKKRIPYLGPRIVMKVKVANKDAMPTTNIAPTKVRYEKISPEYYIKTLEFEGLEDPITLSFKTSPVVEVDIYQLKLTDLDFNYAVNLTKLNFHDVDTSLITSFKQKFVACNNLEYLDMSMLDLSAVINCNMMFMNCKKLLEVNLGNTNLTAVTNVGYMFRGCTVLNKLDLSGFDSANVTVSTGMFQDCENILEQGVRLDGCSDATKELVYNEVATAL